MDSEGLYPFSIVFEDDTLPALHAAADSFIDAEAWVKTINNNIDIQVNSGRDGAMHPQTSRDQDTENSDLKDKSPKADEEERTVGLDPRLPRPKFEKRLLRQRSRQASFIVVVDSADEDEDDGPAAFIGAASENIHPGPTATAARKFDKHATPKDSRGASHSSAKRTLSCDPNLTLGIPAHFQGLANYLYDISVPHPADWTLVRLENRLRIFRDDNFADGWMTSAGYYEKPLLTRELVLGSPSVIAQYLLDVKDTRKSWDVAFLHGNVLDRKNSKSSGGRTMRANEDTVVYATKPIAVLPPFTSPQIAARSFCVRRFTKTLADGSVLIAFDSDAPSVKPEKHIAKSNEVKARMRGGFWINSAGSTNMSEDSAASQLPAFAEQSSIVTMFLQVDAKGWVGAESMFGSATHLESYFTEHMLMSVAGLRNFVESQIYVSGAPLRAPTDTYKAAALTTRNLLGRSSVTSDKIAQASETVANHVITASPPTDTSAETTSASETHKSAVADLSLTELEAMDSEIRSWSLIDYIDGSKCQDTSDSSVMKCWSETDASIFQLRGSNYLEDHIKVTSLPSCLRLVACDLTVRRGAHGSSTASDGGSEDILPLERVAWMEHGLVQRVQRRYGPKAPFLFVINFMIPGGMNNIMYFRVPDATGPEEEGNCTAVQMLRKFMRTDVDDEYRNARLKIIPNVVEGGWVVKRGVGNKPAIIGKKITQTYHAGKNWFEIDVDIGSSRVAGAILGLVKGYTKVLVIDIAFLLEGKTAAELPERMLGSARYFRINLDELAEFPE
eukprot:g4931.t1